MKQRQIAILSLAIAVIVLALAGVVVVAASNTTTTNTDLKQQARQYQATWEAQHSGTHAPKATGSPAAQSCPVDLNITPTVATTLPAIGHQPYTSAIYTVSAEKKLYFIGGGTNQIFVQQQISDPCVIPNTPFPFLTYPASGNVGGIHLTAVSGDIITFTTDAKTTGHFNYVTGQYL